MICINWCKGQAMLPIFFFKDLSYSTVISMLFMFCLPGARVQEFWCCLPREGKEAARPIIKLWRLSTPTSSVQKRTKKNPTSSASPCLCKRTPCRRRRRTRRRPRRLPLTRRRPGSKDLSPSSSSRCGSVHTHLSPPFFLSQSIRSSFPADGVKNGDFVNDPLFLLS
jgi:hypothetical protein